MTALPTNYGPTPSVAYGLVATGSTQAGSLLLTAQVNVFGTVAASTGCMLPQVPCQITIVNGGVSTLTIYPSGGDEIGSSGVNTGVSLVAGNQVTYVNGYPISAAAPRVWQQVGPSTLVSGGTITGTVTNAGTLSGGTFASSIANLGTVEGGFIGGGFGSITPAGSTQANAAAITNQVTQLGTAANTTGAKLPAGTAAPVGIPLLLLNRGTAAVHIYGGNTVDTIDGTAGTTGVTLTNLHNCFYTQISNDGTTGAWVSGPEGGVTS